MSRNESESLVLAVEQLGRFGEIDLGRSDGRAYWTMDTVCQSQRELQHNWNHLQQKAQDAGRRRSVLRAHVTPEVALQVSGLNLPVEANIPIPDGAIIVLGQNVHISEVPEWETVAQEWLDATPLRITPSQRVAQLPPQYELISRPSAQDVHSLTTLWAPFGWTQETIADHIRANQTPKFGYWFSGIRDRSTNQLVSACMGQGADLAGQYIVEATEFGTHADFTGRGLSTAAVSALQAQIVHDSRQNLLRAPLIFSECSLTSRSDLVARKAGQTIPKLTKAHGHQPWQVLRRNVAVLDGQEPNNLPGHAPEGYQSAYAESDHRYWRNFVVTTLSMENMATLYSPQACQEILARIRPVTR